MQDQIKVQHWESEISGDCVSMYVCNLFAGMKQTVIIFINKF